ncbi:MAG: phage minor capsid protein [Clostridium sp.]|uniref:phage minor capsid protein n=1 Tax=Clostridium sp. TaxID=1506 RepID=UPI0039ECF352
MADEIKSPYDLREIFQRMELDLIASLKRNFYRHKNEELKEGFQWEQWQLSKLRNIEKFRKANRELVDKYSEPIQNAIDSVLQESFKAGENRVIKLINQIKSWLVKYIKKEAVIEFPTDISKNTSPQGMEKLKDIVSRVINNPKNNPPPQENNFFGMNDKKLKALTDSVQHDINVAQHSVLRKMDDVYRQTIFKTQVYMQSGATSLNQAIDMATKDFLDKGINSIVYKDGKRVNIASYAEMALRTASQRATFLGEGKKRDEWGLHLVVVSAHANTCKLCVPWQGKILIDDVFSNGTKADGDYPLLSEAMKAGLLHPNCRHTLATYFPGITKLPKVPKDDVINANYKAEQQQRAIEREIRRWKRREAGSLDDKNVQMASDKVKELQDKLRQHLKDNPQLRRDYSREKPGPGISNKDVKVNRETLKTNTENAKIKEIRDLIKSGKQPLNIEHGKQGKHILGHNNYIEGRSYLTIPEKEVQELVNKYAGKGTIRLNQNGKWDKKEIITVNKDIGVNVNNITKVESTTNRFKLHYSKKGVHIVPMIRE